MFQVKCKTFTFIRFCIVHPETFGASWNNVVWLIPRPLQTNIFIGYLFSVEPLIQWTPNETFLLQLCLMWAKTFVWLLKPLGPQAIFHVSDLQFLFFPSETAIWTNTYCFIVCDQIGTQLTSSPGVVEWQSLAKFIRSSTAHRVSVLIGSVDELPIWKDCCMQRISIWSSSL